MAVVIYVLLLRRGAPRWLAALAMAPVLLDAYQLQNEQTIMPDTWFEALIVAGIAILLGSPDVGWRRIVAAGLVLGTSATVAQVGEALILPAVIFVLALGGGWRRALGKAAALCVAFVLPILAYCTGSYLLTGSFFLSAPGRHFALRPDRGGRRLRHDQAARRRAGHVPDPGAAGQGPRLARVQHGSPVRAYYNKLPRGRGRQPDHQLQPPGADPAAAACARCLRPRRGEAVRR